MLILKTEPKIEGLVEIARSFSYKLNTGNYQSMDFFASQKAQCSLEDADAVSAKLYAFCKKQVMEAVNLEMELMALREAKLAKQARRAS